MTDFLNIFGSSTMALSFIIMGAFGLKMASKGTLPYRKRMSYLFCLCILLSGVSRGVGVLMIWFDLEFLNGLIKTFAGVLGLLCVGIIPIVAVELNTTKKIERIENEITDQRREVNTLKKISENMKIRNTRGDAGRR